MCVCTVGALLAEARRGRHPLELELLAFVTCHEGAGKEVNPSTLKK